MDTNEDFFDTIKKKYPELAEKSAENYIGVDKGWHTLIDVLCGCIYRDVYAAKKRLEYAEKSSENEETVLVYKRAVAIAIDDLPCILQIKEKFGTLRFYVNGGNDKVDALIEYAEEMSAHTCEICGSPGSQTNTGWIRTLCDTHKQNKV